MDIDNLIVSNTLITAYGRCKDTDSINDALSIFDGMHPDDRDGVTLSAMMKCFMKSDQLQNALDLYSQQSSLHNEITAMLALKCCLSLNDLQSGISVLDSLPTTPQIQHSQLINTMIDFHAHFGDIHSASTVYNAMNPEQRDTSTVNAILKGLLSHKRYHDALRLYEGFADSTNNSNCIKVTDLIHSLAIKACGALKDLERAQNIHCSLKMMEKTVNSKVMDALIGCYFECGAIEKAKHLFHEIASKQTNPSSMMSVRTINAMMKGAVLTGDYGECLRLYDTISPPKRDEVSHLYAVKACIQSNDLERGVSIHYGIGGDTGKLPGIAIQNVLIEFYAHFGRDYLNEARSVFEGLEDNKKVYSAGSLMKMYIDFGDTKKALRVYDVWKCSNENVPHVLAIKACTVELDYERGRDIHYQLSEHSLRCLEVLNALINFYGDCGDMESAKKVFDGIGDGQKDIVTVSSMMKALLNCDSSRDALNLYDAVHSHSVYAHIQRDGILHTLGIKACAELRDLERGKLIHFAIRSLVDVNGNGDNDGNAEAVQLRNGLIKMYGDCGDLENAEKLFLSIPEHHQMDIVAFNSMMKALMDNGEDEKALALYDDDDGTMKKKERDEVSHMLAITACINLEDFKRGKGICDALRSDTRMLMEEEEGTRLTRDRESTLKLKTTMISCYGHNQDIESALEIYNSIARKERNIVIVSAMMEAYWCCDLHSLSIRLFEDLPKMGLKPEIGCFVTALKACTSGTILHIGRRIHDEVEGTAMMRDLGILINLIKMYGKCGDLEKCREIFENALRCGGEEIKGNIGIWNAMIHALGRNGETDAVLAVYERLKVCEFVAVPDVKTFMHLIGACSHSGDIEKAQQIWNGIDDLELKFNGKVMATLVDCLARKGALKEAQELVVENRVTEASAWVSLISGCKKHGDLERAENVYEKMQQIFEGEKDVMSPASVLMAGIYGVSLRREC